MFKRKAFENKTKSVILFNYSLNNVFFAVASFSCSGNNFNVSSAVLSNLEDPQKGKYRKIIFRLLLVATFGYIAYSAKNIEKVIGFFGSLFCAPISFTIPVFLWKTFF
eukprot:TRINITY_DN3491_c0_g1_i4.p2 TRINITY_DN3491_c0_g1~~TRINITY_DN3491_c0_g1_i4.p2  ORF type:complete len:108 (-),score=5.22 TRINITY_DN3491_c0_g1_i4:191-514(-)